jgi:hypothetical protein
MINFSYLSAVKSHREHLEKWHSADLVKLIAEWNSFSTFERIAQTIHPLGSSAKEVSAAEAILKERGDVTVGNALGCRITNRRK